MAWSRDVVTGHVVAFLSVGLKGRLLDSSTDKQTDRQRDRRTHGLWL